MDLKLIVFCIIIAAAKLSAGEVEIVTKDIRADDNIFRIIWGRKAKITDFPFFAALEECGAAILSKHWLITTAHCVRKYKDENNGYSTDSKHKSYPFWVGGTTKHRSKRYQFRKIIKHPKHDLALLKVHHKPLKFSKKVQPVQLPKHDLKRQCATFIGKGADETGSIWSHLRSACIYAYPLRSPHSFYGVPCHYGRICYGDFGGPLVDKKKRLLGLARFNTQGDCYSSKGTFFLDIAKHTKWIKRNIKDAGEDFNSTEEDTGPKPDDNDLVDGSYENVSPHDSDDILSYEDVHTKVCECPISPEENEDPNNSDRFLDWDYEISGNSDGNPDDDIEDPDLIINWEHYNPSDNYGNLDDFNVDPDNSDGICDDEYENCGNNDGNPDNYNEDPENSDEILDGGYENPGDSDENPDDGNEDPDNSDGNSREYEDLYLYSSIFKKMKKSMIA